MGNSGRDASSDDGTPAGRPGADDSAATVSSGRSGTGEGMVSGNTSSASEGARISAGGLVGPCEDRIRSPSSTGLGEVSSGVLGPRSPKGSCQGLEGLRRVDAGVGATGACGREFSWGRRARGGKSPSPSSRSCPRPPSSAGRATSVFPWSCKSLSGARSWAGAKYWAGARPSSDRGTAARRVFSSDDGLGAGGMPMAVLPVTEDSTIGLACALGRQRRFQRG